MIESSSWYTARGERASRMVSAGVTNVTTITKMTMDLALMMGSIPVIHILHVMRQPASP
jgi:hypothetical protein